MSNDNNISNNTNSDNNNINYEIMYETIFHGLLLSLRLERNKKLVETDKYSMPDWPHSSDEIRHKWFTYRQALRDLPENATLSFDDDGKEIINKPWPIPPF